MTETRYDETDDVEVEDLEQDKEVVPFYDITSYGADYPVDSLITRLNSSLSV